MSSPSTLPTPEGVGSVSGAPNLPAGFTDTFTSRYVDDFTTDDSYFEHGISRGARVPYRTLRRAAAVADQDSARAA